VGEAPAFFRRLTMNHDVIPIGGVRPIIEVIGVDQSAPSSTRRPLADLDGLLAAAEQALPVLGALCGNPSVRHVYNTLFDAVERARG
jgi:hypothetical protein